MDIGHLGTVDVNSLKARNATQATGGSPWAIGTVTIFTVTGQILLKSISAYCLVNLAGATATISLGTANNVDGLIAVTTATDLDAGEHWTAAAPADTELLALPAAHKDILISSDIILDVLVANVTAGAILYDIEYAPLTTASYVS